MNLIELPKNIFIYLIKNYLNDIRDYCILLRINKYINDITKNTPFQLYYYQNPIKLKIDTEINGFSVYIIYKNGFILEHIKLFNRDLTYIKTLLLHSQILILYHLDQYFLNFKNINYLNVKNFNLSLLKYNLNEFICSGKLSIISSFNKHIKIKKIILQFYNLDEDILFNNLNILLESKITFNIYLNFILNRFILPKQVKDKLLNIFINNLNINWSISLIDHISSKLILFPFDILELNWINSFKNCYINSNTLIINNYLNRDNYFINGSLYFNGKHLYIKNFPSLKFICSNNLESITFICKNTFIIKYFISTIYSSSKHEINTLDLHFNNGYIITNFISKLLHFNKKMKYWYKLTKNKQLYHPIYFNVLKFTSILRFNYEYMFIYVYKTLKNFKNSNILILNKYFNKYDFKYYKKRRIENNDLILEK